MKTKFRIGVWLVTFSFVPIVFYLLTNATKLSQNSMYLLGGSVIISFIGFLLIESSSKTYSNFWSSLEEIEKLKEKLKESQEHWQEEVDMLAEINIEFYKKNKNETKETNRNSN